jgi:hypothetical protein
MKRILCIMALLLLTASTAGAYVRQAVGGGHVVRGAGVYSGRYAGGYHGRGYYGHPVARGAALAGAAAVAATGWGLSQPYYGGGYYGGYGYGGNGTGGYYGAYAYPDAYGDAYAAYPGDYGGYAHRSYITGRTDAVSTLLRLVSSASY